MIALHRLARFGGMALAGLGVVTGLAILGCGPDAPARPDVDEGFWDDGRPETAMIVAFHEADRSTGAAGAAIAEADALSITHGPQGGSHVEVVVELDPAMSVATARLGARLEREDGSVVAEAFLRELWSEPVDGVVRQPVFVIVFEDTSGPLLLRVRARDASGVQGTTEIGVLVR
jgi:hypothetical protein